MQQVQHGNEIKDTEVHLLPNVVFEEIQHEHNFKQKMEKYANIISNTFWPKVFPVLIIGLCGVV